MCIMDCCYAVIECALPIVDSVKGFLCGKIV